MLTMLRTPAGLLQGAMMSALSLFCGDAARGDDMGKVDAAIVLAVDTSASIDPEQADRQRNGHADALRSHEVQSAIRSGSVGCIAIAYVEWSSAGRLRTVMPWRRLCGRNDAVEAALLIDEQGYTGRGVDRGGRTSLSYAIEASSLMLDDFPGEAPSKIVDISANGTNNDGISVAQARSTVLARGQVINAIILSRTEVGVADNLYAYFRDNVIGGPSSFGIVADEPADYVQALKRKLVLEISSATTPSPPW